MSEIEEIFTILDDEELDPVIKSDAKRSFLLETVEIGGKSGKELRDHIAQAGDEPKARIIGLLDDITIKRLNRFSLLEDVVLNPTVRRESAIFRKEINEGGGLTMKPVCVFIGTKFIERQTIKNMAPTQETLNRFNFLEMREPNRFDFLEL